MKALEPYWKKAVAEGQPIHFTSSAGARYFLRNVTTDELLKMKRDRAVDLELLFRRGVRDEFRREALADLARLDKKDALVVLIDAIGSQDEQKGNQEEERRLRPRPAPDRPPRRRARPRPRRDSQQMATGAKLPVTRQLGFVALIAADGSVDQAWTLGTQSVQALQDLLGAMPLVRDGNLRASLYPKVKPLLHGLPEIAGRAGEGEADSRAASCGSSCRARGRSTLAEVEVQSDGRNLARQGRATQKNTAHGGDAQKAIDGKTERRLWRRQPDPHRGEHQEPVVGSRPRLRGPDRVDRDLQPHRRDPRQAARRIHPQGPRRRPQRRLRAVEPEGPRRAGALRGHPRGGESGRPDPPRGDDRPDVRPRPGDRDLPGAGAVRPR